MTKSFSVMVQQFVKDGCTIAIPNPARSGYLCTRSDFLSELIRFLSMMQVLKVGVGNEIAMVKKGLELANHSLVVTQSDDQLYNTMVNVINRLIDICIKEGEKAYTSEEIELAETYAWCIAGCKLFLEYR